VTRALGPGGDRRFIAFSGEPLDARGGPHTGWQGVARDVSPAHRAREPLRQLAHRDRPSGLLNRAATESALQLLLDDAAHDGFRVRVMIVDLDGFKAVKDRLGHAAGGDLASRTSARPHVRTSARPRGCAAARLREATAPPIVVEGRTRRLGATIGSRLYPDDALDPASLLRRADAAMYEARRRRRAARRP
jgi:GGDEF domain-containing protein